jgi:hypothetical protein
VDDYLLKDTLVNEDDDNEEIESCVSDRFGIIV